MATAETDIVMADTPAAGREWAYRAVTSTPFLGAAVAVLTWPISSIVPSTGPDPSWMAGLYMAHGEGLQFGRDIVFTYGPLGFLEVPVLYEQAMWIVAFLYQALVHVALAISLIWVARRAFPLPVAVAACYSLLVIGRLEGAVVLLAFIWCLVALDEGAPRFSRLLVTVGGGVLAGVELLGKANYGLAILVFSTLTVLGLPQRRRNAPLFAAVAAGSFVASWMASGQDPSGVFEFAARSAQVIAGYSNSMGTDILAIGWELPAAIVAMAVLLVAAAVATWGNPLPRRLASLALVALFSFMIFKQGFVRQGLGNTPEFFVLIACGGMAVASRLPRFPYRVVALGLTVPLAGLALMALPSPSLWESLKPQAHLEFMRQGIDALIVPGERDRLISEARNWMRSAYKLDPGIVRALGDRSVHVDPWEVGVAWAYGLNWHPLPVMQSYSAYTRQLDELNAGALDGRGAPAAILRYRALAPARGSRGAIDDRYPGWESPAAMRAMLCHYRAVRTSAHWQLLERGAHRCGLPRLIGVVHSTTGRQILVPPPPSPGDMVFARIDGIGARGWELLRAALYRARERSVRLGGRGTWKLVPDTAADGLILRAPTLVDYPKPFQLAPDVHFLSLRIAGAPPRSFTVMFYAQRVRRFSAPVAAAGPNRFSPQSRTDRGR